MRWGLTGVGHVISDRARRLKESVCLQLLGVFWRPYHHAHLRCTVIDIAAEEWRDSMKDLQGGFRERDRREMVIAANEVGQTEEIDTCWKRWGMAAPALATLKYNLKSGTVDRAFLWKYPCRLRTANIIEGLLRRVVGERKSSECSPTLSRPNG